MDVKFEKSLCSFLDTPLREVQNSEQTQEIKLSDGMPDIGSVLCAWGQVILRAKEWRRDSVHFSGGMMVWVLYKPEDGSQERCIDSWIPFQMRWDLPEDTPEGKVRIMCLPRFVDARSVSARKIMVRAGLAAMAEASVGRSVEVYSARNAPENVELLQSTYPVHLAKEAGEKAFAMEQELVLPDSAPHPQGMICCSLSPRTGEKRVVGGKLVFRGTGNLHILYRSEEGQLHSWDFELPYSQFTELEQEYSPEAQPDIAMEITSLDTELDGEGHFHVKAGLVAQYRICDVEKLSLVEDAYSPQQELELDTEELKLPVILENRREVLRPEQTVHADANLMVDSRFWPDFPRQKRTEQGVELAYPGVFQTLYYGENGQLASAAAKWEGTQKWNADDESQITAVPQSVQSDAAAGAGEIALRGEVPVDLTSSAEQIIPMVTGVRLGQKRQRDPERPSLILRRAGEQRLWDIAKASGTTMQAIRSANQLTEDPEPGRLILIPVP